MPLPDIESALKSFQTALDDGAITVPPGEFDTSVQFHADRPDGDLRLTYVRLEGRRVASMVQLMSSEPYEGERCYGVSWAVPQDLRGQGRAGATLLAAVREFRHQVSRHGVPAFWIEAVVGVYNLASQRVAEKVISSQGSRSIDNEAGVPILQYFRRVDGHTPL